MKKDTLGRGDGFAPSEVEQELRQSEERYRSLVELSPDAIAVHSEGKYVYINPAGVKIYGARSPEEIIGRAVLDLVHPDYREFVLARMRQSYHHLEPAPLRESKLLRIDGSGLDVEVATAPIVYNGKQATQMILRDISERKRTEELERAALIKAAEEQNKSEAIIAAIADGISIQDKEFKVVYQNQLHRDLTGGDHAGEYCYKAYRKRDAVCEHCPVALSFLDGNRHTEELTAVQKGIELSYELVSAPLRDTTGEIVAAVSIMRDITSRKQMEEEKETLIEELRDVVDTVSRSKQEWRDTFDNIQDPIYITDAEFNIIKANKAFSEFAGRKFSDVIGRKCYDMLHGSCEPYVECPHQVMQKTGKPAHIELVEPKHKRSLVITHFPYKTAKGAPAGSINIVRDVTEDREKEMQFIMNERLASLGQMAASIAHEINNPLAAIMGCAEGLLSRVNQEHFDPTLFRTYLEIIEEEVARCKNISTSMLSYVRKSSLEKKTIDVHETLDRTLEIVGFQGRLKKVKIVKHYAPEGRSAYGNDSELKQVFLTLITNALDAMHDYGVLTFETGSKEGEVFVCVSDTGDGIPQEQINRIFDPFFTTKAEYGGTGLGLSIAKKIMADHHGDIRVATECGKGTTFTVSLPASGSERFPQEATGPGPAKLR